MSLFHSLCDGIYYGGMGWQFGFSSTEVMNFDSRVYFCWARELMATVAESFNKLIFS